MAVGMYYSYHIRIEIVKRIRTHSSPRTSDNTNADPETRIHWISLAKEVKVPIRCIYITASPELCKHNNAVRAANRDMVRYNVAIHRYDREHELYVSVYANHMILLYIQNPESRASLPGIAFGDFNRRFREPTLNEGFQDITRVNFRFRGGEAEKKIWSKYWI